MEPTRDRDYFLMTTKTEQRQAIWYVTGLAEVLVGPGAQDQSDDDWISGAMSSSRMSKAQPPQRNSFAQWAI